MLLTNKIKKNNNKLNVTVKISQLYIYCEVPEISESDWRNVVMPGVGKQWNKLEIKDVIDRHGSV